MGARGEDGGAVVVGREHRHHLALEVGLGAALKAPVAAHAAARTAPAASCSAATATAPCPCAAASAAACDLLVHEGGARPGVGVSCETRRGKRRDYLHQRASKHN